MPAMHLISVDFPAPLSPTSAMTSPERTSKSTSTSACTEPKLFDTPRVSSVGVETAACVGVGSAGAMVTSFLSCARVEAPHGAPPSLGSTSYLQNFAYSPRQTFDLF